MQEGEAKSDLPSSTSNPAEPGAGFVLKEGDPDFSHLDSAPENILATENYYHNRNTGLSIQVSEAEVEAEDGTSGPIVNIELGSDENFTYSEFFNKQVKNAVPGPEQDLNYDQRALAELHSAELSEVNYSVDPGW